MRKPTRTVITIAVVLLVSITVAAQKQPRPTPAANVVQPSFSVPCGRFQIVQGRVGMDMGGSLGPLQRDTLLRIDTETGQTWVYLWPAGDKNTPEGWMLVAELPRVTWTPPAQP